MRKTAKDTNTEEREEEKNENGKKMESDCDDETKASLLLWSNLAGNTFFQLLF